MRKNVNVKQPGLFSCLETCFCDIICKNETMRIFPNEINFDNFGNFAIFF